MACDAPLHLERVFLIDRRHRVYSAVTCHTSNTLAYVNAMIEINKLGQIVDAFPLDRLILAKTCSYGLKVRAVIPKLAVTVHACLSGR